MMFIHIYQWGSLLENRHFSEMSDIDIALEGVMDPVLLSGLLGKAEQLTSFPLDIVAIEQIHPAYAEYIRHRGKVAYEQK